ncbi:hypothetical protein F0562_014246 [Nyssa sinensis]|uniref:Late embryogenesis abundant protein LEA-2 subgroup domain-containing protein n=1 Tax=Nyssa sinensis TaxID=561372 RepID=A0A5J4ZN37_9ASTE|nr:hypothetical protein F0562_014246 [Nyssa sinensis]
MNTHNQIPIEGADGNASAGAGAGASASATGDNHPLKRHHTAVYYMHRMTVYYKDQSIGGASLSLPFYQRPKNTVVLHSALRGATLRNNRRRWMPFRSGRTKGTIVFRLDVTSTIRFRVLTWRTTRHKMHANCAVGVGLNGLILASYKDKRCPVYFT